MAPDVRDAAEANNSLKQLTRRRRHDVADAHNCVSTMPELGWCVGAAVGVICAIRWASAAVYDVLIVKMTSKWYASVLKDLDRSSTLLDVDIGTATACVEINR